MRQYVFHWLREVHGSQLQSTSYVGEIVVLRSSWRVEMLKHGFAVQLQIPDMILETLNLWEWKMKRAPFCHGSHRMPGLLNGSQYIATQPVIFGIIHAGGFAISLFRRQISSASPRSDQKWKYVLRKIFNCLLLEFAFLDVLVYFVLGLHICRRGVGISIIVPNGRTKIDHYIISKVDQTRKSHKSEM